MTREFCADVNPTERGKKNMVLIKDTFAYALPRSILFFARRPQQHLAAASPR